MRFNPHCTHGGVRLIVRIAAVVFVIGILTGRGDVAARAAPPGADAAFTPHRLERIEPGTRIGDAAPSGWSHLVAKTRSAVTQGDVDETPAMTVKFANMFFTSMAVKTSRHETPEGMRYELDRVAIGLGTPIDGNDTIVSSATYSDLGADIGEIGAIVLGRLEEQIDQVVEVARSTTMSLVDAPIYMLRDGAHVEVVLRYALLVDPRDGHLYTLVWVLDRKEGGGYEMAANSPLILVQSNLVTTRELHVDASKIFLGIPSTDAFAIFKLPPGVPRTLSDAVKSQASAGQFTPQSAHELELGLWKAIFAAKS